MAILAQPIANNKATKEPAPARADCLCCKLAHPDVAAFSPRAEPFATQLVTFLYTTLSLLLIHFTSYYTQLLREY
jgi:hypothetical protein